MFDRSSFSSGDPETLTDRELFEAAQRIGSVALKSRRAFIGLLPLVERRRVYDGRTFYSIYDFAAKVGGVGREVVEEVLRLDNQLREFPLVQKLLYSGKVGWTKIRTVMHWLMPENQQEWIKKLENLSNRALEVYVRDFRKQVYEEGVATLFIDAPRVPLTLESPSTESFNDPKTAENKAENFHVEISEYNRINPTSQDDALRESYLMQPSKLDQLATQRETFTFSMRSDLAARLRLFRQKLEKDRRELVTWEEVMSEFLKMIEGEVQYVEKKKSEEAIKKEQEKSQEKLAQAQQDASQKPATRYIPAHIRQLLDAQHQGLCAFKECKQPATSYHHTRRFALTSDGTSQSEVHDPRYIKPLCKAHERIVHNTLVENEECDSKMWKLLAAPDSDSQRGKIDQKVQQYRKP